MSRKISKAMLAMACFNLLGMGFAPVASAQACSLSQTAGKWGFSTNGTVVRADAWLQPKVSAAVGVPVQFKSVGGTA
jgi:hypothetical protein